MEEADSSGSGLVTSRRSRKVNATDMHPAPRADPRKRTYDEMSQEADEASASQSQFRQPASASLNRSFPPPPSPNRYHGDGFDFRRPVMSTTMPTLSGVIDLTDDAEPAPARSTTFPRFQRTQRVGSAHTQWTERSAATSQPEVIDLDDDHATGFQRAHTPQRHTERDSSPEVEFVASNPLNINRGGDDYTGSLPRSSATAPTGSSYFRNGPFSNNIGLQIARIFSDSIRGGYFGRRNIMGVGMGSLTPHIRHRQAVSQRHRRQAHGRAQLPDSFRTHLPGELNYDATAFPFPIPEPAPRLPTYQKPSSPREGYTRAPNGEEIVVCPNCDQELGTGDDDLKRQVWVVRACGHVYCGECAAYRTKTSRKGRADITAPTFSKCVVDGCGKAKTSGPKAMIQVYI